MNGVIVGLEVLGVALALSWAVGWKRNPFAANVAFLSVIAGALSLALLGTWAGIWRP